MLLNNSPFAIYYVIILYLHKIELLLEYYSLTTLNFLPLNFDFAPYVKVSAINKFFVWRQEQLASPQIVCLKIECHSTDHLVTFFVDFCSLCQQHTQTTQHKIVTTDQCVGGKNYSSIKLMTFYFHYCDLLF